jgi:threonine dehydrogenase-like Zn-dependent dehydrogenase
MAERVCVPERNVHPIPDGLDDLEAVFIEPLAAAFRIAEQVPLGPGCRLAVLGDGKLGLLCAWATRLTGAEVHLIGKHDEKLARAGAGIETHRLADAESLNRGFDVVVEATGSPSGLSTALTLVKPCGTVVLKTTVAAPHQLSLAPIVIDEVRVIGSRCGPFPVAIQALADRRIDVRPLIEAVYPLVQAERAFEHAARPGVRKILLRVDS